MSVTDMKMSKRQRLIDSTATTATDVMEAIDEIQSLIPSFTMSMLVDKIREIEHIVAHTSVNIRTLYSLIHEKEWYIEADREACTLHLIINTGIDKATLLQSLISLGFNEHVQHDYHLNVIVNTKEDPVLLAM
jgi:hypothetical protein